MLSEHKGFHCQHRSDDFPAIAAIVTPHRPLVVVELGTDTGGFAGWLAALVAPWGGVVHTFDITTKIKPKLLAAFKNLRYHEADVLAGVHPDVAALVSQPGVLLYCDNGNKQHEVELYAPLLLAGSLLAVHDYNAEIKGEWVEPHVAALGYAPEGHDRMEALRNEWYPEPMTRLWLRKSILRPAVPAPAPAAPKKAAASPVAKTAPAPAAAAKPPARRKR